ncbi:MAG: efflux RND transporter periplasmic adaptor subunit [Acidobacteriota bacterium]
MKMEKIAKIGGVLVAVLLVLVWLTYHGGKKSAPPGQTAKQEAPAEKGKKERKIKYWVAPMDPSYRRDKPGKSPMGMDLVPVYENEGEPTAEGVIKIDPITVQNIGVRTVKVTKGPLVATVRTVGRVTYDEQRVERIQTKVSGWVEQLFVDTTGQNVRKGEKLLTIYSPELVATQQEYLQALRYAEQTAGSSFKDIASGGGSLVDATKRRLLLMDIAPGQIQALEKRGEVQKTMVLDSPVSGVVIDKKVLAGMKVGPGMELYTIADLSRVWIIGSIYEYELPFVRNGQEAEITLPYEPGMTYKGRISFIYPYLSAATRTVQVRIEFKNPGLKLKPDMYVNVVLKSREAGDVLQVPSDAVIRTGTRDIVITALGEGKFLPKEVTVGPEGQGMVEIKSGLKEGDTVVVSGQFLIDSESNLRAAVAKMTEPPAQRGVPAGQPQPGAAEKGAKSEETPPAMQLQLSQDQQRLMSEIVGTCVKIHNALIADSAEGVRSNAKGLDSLLSQLVKSDPQGKLEKITAPIAHSLEDGLLSGDLAKQRDAFVPLNRVLVAYVKGSGREAGRSADIKIFYCPMKKEPWLQKGKAVQNPYLGKDMLLCGNEIKY